MLQKVSKALLISDVASFQNNYSALAEDIGVALQVEADWNEKYRVTADVVILGSKNMDKLNKAYYPRAVIILKEGERPAPYIKKGVTRFIFNYKNKYELLTALFRAEPVIIHASDLDYDEIVKSSVVMSFCYGDYDFRFNKSQFLYKKKPIYLTNSAKKYLAEWLLNGHKDNSKRMILCNLRKKFGSEFLSEINRHGEFEGGKDDKKEVQNP